MKVKIKRIDKSIELPIYQTAGSVGFDIMVREKTTIAAKSIELLPGNVIVDVPDGYMLAIASRSSTPRKKGLIPPHGLGIVDQDYCGPEDEVKVLVYNFLDQDVVVEKGERIAQGLFVRVDKFEWQEVDEIATESRGGYGSTG